MEQKLEMPLNDTLLVGFDFTHDKDKNVLIVGKKNGEKIEIINAFQGENAKAMYELLTTKP
jgi:hypothetical protein